MIPDKFPVKKKGQILGAGHINRLGDAVNRLQRGIPSNLHGHGDSHSGLMPFEQRLVIYEPDTDGASANAGIVTVKPRYWDSVEEEWATNEDVEYDLDLDSVGGVAVTDGDILTAWWEPMRGAFIPIWFADTDSAGNLVSTAVVAVASGAITARSGTTLGSGTAILATMTGAVVAPAAVESVYNPHSYTIPSGSYLMLNRVQRTDGSRVWGIVEVDFGEMSSSYDILSSEPTLNLSTGVTIPFDTPDTNVTNAAIFNLPQPGAGEFDMRYGGKIEIYAQVLAKNIIDGNIYKWMIWLQKWNGAAWSHVPDSVVPGYTDGGTADGATLSFTRQIDLNAGQGFRVRGMQLNGTDNGVQVISQRQPSIDVDGAGGAALHYGSKLIVKILRLY